ncbi:MAG: AraD1 family protein [Vicinamibacterales bacterium]
MSATRLVQIRNGPERRVALVVEDELRLLAGSASVYELAEQALAADRTLTALVAERATGDDMDYAAVYAGVSPWRLLPPIDHPAEPTRCLVSGTGLTHMGSARDRQAMHTTAPEEVTDSMRMFRSGLEGGRPEPGRIGTAPEWFYKGTGTILRAHGEPLLVPSYAEDGGEEAEVAGVYVVDSEGRPRRLGMAVGNEFSDHRFERKNYLNLAGSKLRTCSLGPELAVDPGFDSVPGRVTLERAGSVLWSKEIRSGEAEMCHSLQNVEHHHFKFEAHRRPGDLHVHFFGAHGLSFGDGVELRDGDVMEIRFEGFGRALRNPVSVSRASDPLVKVQPLG